MAGLLRLFDGPPAPAECPPESVSSPGRCAAGDIRWASRQASPTGPRHRQGSPALNSVVARGPVGTSPGGPGWTVKRVVECGGDAVRGWQVRAPGPDLGRSLRRATMAVPRPAAGELLVAVDACGVCRTDLHVAAGELPVHRPSVVPGHEVVGHVLELGEGVTGFRPGDRVGVAWLRETCGRCRYCRAGAENLCPRSRYTGWDADGGYADCTTVRADFAYPLPDGYSDIELAPLLCAGIIGYRALRRAELPPGGRLGIYGFGASAHLTAQGALAEGARGAGA